jgi:hypothetical protein
LNPTGYVPSGRLKEDVVIICSPFAVAETSL